MKICVFLKNLCWVELGSSICGFLGHLGDVFCFLPVMFAFSRRGGEGEAKEVGEEGGGAALITTQKP